MNVINRDTIVENLRSGVCRVKFVKRDGAVRDMRCSLNTEDIPEQHRPSSNREYSESTVRVYDVEAQGWRSFRVDSVTDFEPNIT